MELKTPLYDAHVKAGGKIVEFGGYLLPVQYETGVIKEHMAHIWEKYCVKGKMLWRI